jgi:hypothetical protein
MVMCSNYSGKKNRKTAYTKDERFTFLRLKKAMNKKANTNSLRTPVYTCSALGFP